MAGAPKQLSTVTNLDASSTEAIDGSGGSHGAASFFLDLTNITPAAGSLNVVLQWRTAAGNTITIAEVLGLTSTGIVNLPVEAAFADTRNAIIEPVEVSWFLNADAADVEGTVYAMYGE